MTPPTAARPHGPADRDWPIRTCGELTPPAKFVHDEDGRRGHAVASLVSGGCIVSGGTLWRSLLFTGVRIPPGLVVGEDPALDAQRFRRIAAACA